MKISKKIAIHQPNFLPWIKYFSKIAMSDIFVILDDVQYPQGGGTWTNRHKLLYDGKPIWFTVPVSRPSGKLSRVKDIQINTDYNWKIEFKRRIDSYYMKSPCYGEIISILEYMIDPIESNSLSEINFVLIQSISDLLSLPVPVFIKSSELTVDSTGTERLVQICQKLSGDVYLCGNGSSKYLKEDKFWDHGIKIEYQSPNEKEYFQPNRVDFCGGLSIVDALMNIGVKETRKLVLQY